MHLVVLFLNIGGYHAARLRALQSVCKRRNWKLTAVQVTDNSRDYPWGNIEREITFNLTTLLPSASRPLDLERGERAKASVRAVRGFLNSTRPDVVVIPGWGHPFSRGAQAWARRNGALTILTSETKRDDAKRRWWKERIKSTLYVRRFDAALVGGQLHRDYLVELGFPRDRIFLGNNVVDNAHFQERAAAARLDPESTRQLDLRIPNRRFVLAVTRLVGRKNVTGLIEAFGAYRQQIGERAAWNLAICGTGEGESHVRGTIKALRLGDYIHLPGFVGYQQLGNWYGLATAFIHPALQEPWGLVVNEACAAGLPIMGSRTVGACHELVRENENGFLFDPARSEDITRALVRMHTLDESSRNSFGRESQRIVAPLSPQLFGTNLVRAIEVASA